ncbi:MAG: FeoB-associated Cys-rich membrane protein [Lentisphaerae bacterium]|jgi:hypothetical protein|nr:FeoB-associated Cys-rich membrane protein [Lentisphaerota bacterium]MBT4823056.1 FeoB-associated Cys-rich membrane protein [Lentisphaerota bacterium]MBT5610581.1 FeoB-associated Cys-rich membrane protein [Lentisphaerota bacterium]MBT7060175.1 FeoB-associated Cys-rich membrane protein [Lentisphaerota bacterium]MBT7844140.1 FeoB-associated Cys-rich membrane protein [Lentisphaerota bacterium]
METVIAWLIVGAAVAWGVRSFAKALKGEAGCGCSGCSGCPSATPPADGPSMSEDGPSPEEKNVR